MAANKPFANFDRLSKLATPSITTPSSTPTQGGAKINPGFAKQISLADRLKQSSLGTTKHLAQYFVTDQFTNVIKIKKPIDIPKESLVSINAPNETRAQGGELPRTISFLPIQGETDPRAPRYNLAERQGIVRISEDFEGSNVTILPPSETNAKLLAQGVYYLNGQYFSTTQTSTLAQQVEQGSVEIKKSTVVINQGGLDYKKPITVADIERIQGLVTINSKTTSSTSLLLPAPTVNQGDGTIPTATAPADAYIEDQSVSLRTLTYVTLNAGLRLLPELIQGGQQSRPALSVDNLAIRQHSEGGLNPTNELEGEGGHKIAHARSATISQFLNPPAGTANFTQAQLQGGLLAGRGGLDGYDKIGKNPNNNVTFQNAGLYNSQPRQQLAISVLNPVTGMGGDQSAKLIKLVMDDASNGRAGERSVDDYEKYFKPQNESPNNTVASVEVGGIQNQPNPNIPITNALGSTDNDPSQAIINIINQKIDFKEHRKGFNGSYKFYGNVTNYNQIIQAVNRAPRSDAKRPGATISIAPVEGGDIVIFDAFLKTFSDNVAAAYTDFKHIGQMDTFKVYSGTTRQLSVGWTAISMPGSRDFDNSSVDAKTLLRDKINKLINICAVGTANGQYIKAPIIRIQVAGMVTGLICACNSVKVDVPIADTPWDVETQLPHMYDVSLDLAVLAMENDQLLTKYGLFYSV